MYITLSIIYVNNSLIGFDSMVDTNLLEAYMFEMEGHVSYDQYEIVFGDLLEMYASVMSLLTACVVYDTPTRQDILANKDFIMSALALMTIRFQGMHLLS